MAATNSSVAVAPPDQNQRDIFPFLLLSLTNVTSAHAPSGKRMMTRCVSGPSGGGCGRPLRVRCSSSPGILLSNLSPVTRRAFLIAL